MRNLLISTLLAVTAAGPAAAGDSDRSQATTIVATVSVKDLDLSSDPGLRQLRRRIASATEAVCGSYGGVEEHERIIINRCRDQVRIQVRSQLARVAGTPNVRMSAVELR